MLRLTSVYLNTTNLNGHFSIKNFFSFCRSSWCSSSCYFLIHQVPKIDWSLSKITIDWSLSLSSFKNITSFHNMYCNVFLVSYINEFKQKFTSYEANKSILDIVNDFVYFCKNALKIVSTGVIFLFIVIENMTKRWFVQIYSSVSLYFNFSLYILIFPVFWRHCYKLTERERKRERARERGRDRDRETERDTQRDRDIFHAVGFLSPIILK